MTLGLVVAVGFALGCGSGEDEATSVDETTAAATPLTKAEFIKQADAICTENAKQRQQEVVAWEKESAGEINLKAGLMEVVGPALQREAEELEALPPPKGDEENVTRLIESLSQLGKGLEEIDVKENVAPKTERFQREATAYGLKACSTL